MFPVQPLGKRKLLITALVALPEKSAVGFVSIPVSLQAAAGAAKPVASSSHWRDAVALTHEAKSNWRIETPVKTLPVDSTLSVLLVNVVVDDPVTSPAPAAPPSTS